MQKIKVKEKFTQENKVQEYINLKKYNTFKIDIVARYFFILKDEACFLTLFEFIKNKKLECGSYNNKLEQVKEKSIPIDIKKEFKYMMLGGGSNVLFKNTKDDNIFYGLIIKNEIKFLQESEKNKNQDSEVFLEVGSGYEWDSFVKYCCENNFYGLENMSHIPGTVGAAPIQNIGAYGAEVKDYIMQVTCIDIEKSIQENKIIEKVFTNLECEFRYRDSIFKKEKFIVNNLEHNRKNLFIKSVTFKLSKTKKFNLEYKDIQDYIIKNKVEQKLFIKENKKNNVEKYESSRDNVSDNYKEDNFTLLEIREMIISIRNSKMPNWRDVNSLGTAGSFFKNIIVSESEYEKLLSKDFENKIEEYRKEECKTEDLYKNIPAYKITEPKTPLTPVSKRGGEGKVFYKLSSGYIIDKILNMKNVRVGDVGTFEKQALIIVNYGNASGANIYNFSQKIIDECKSVTGLDLEREVNII